MLRRLLQPNLRLLQSSLFSSNKSRTPIAREEEMSEIFRRVYSNKEKRIYSFYSSDYDRIVVDEHLMLIPVDERMATRAHAVFDTIYIKRLHIINVHIAERSCKSTSRGS